MYEQLMDSRRRSASPSSSVSPLVASPTPEIPTDASEMISPLLSRSELALHPRGWQPIFCSTNLNHI